MLFNDSIGYNIAYGREGAGQDEVEAAARGAAIDGSSRCCRRVAIDGRRARVEAVGGREARGDCAHPTQRSADPNLDEATSALDSRTEEADPATLDGVQRHRTTWSSPTACRRSSAPTRSSCSTQAKWPSAALIPNCSPRVGSIRNCRTGRRPNAIGRTLSPRASVCFSEAEQTPARTPTRPPNPVCAVGGRVVVRAGAG